jgi:hypothetical protein
LGGHPSHPNATPAAIRWQIKRSSIATDTVHILSVTLPNAAPVMTVHRSVAGARECLEQAVRGNSHARSLYVAAVGLEVTRADGVRVGGAANLSYTIQPTELLE